MLRNLALLIALIFSVLGLLHFYWAAGGSLGGGAAIPSIAGEKIFTPSGFASTAVGLLLFLGMYAFLGRIGFLTFGFPAWLFRVGTAMIAVIFGLRSIGEFRYVGFFKSVRDSEFAAWDSYLFSPLCLFIAISAFLISYFDPVDPH
ncbi:MAG: DUF3995 domain-containing protein [Pyrinomonadaceae bacterium]